MIKTIENVAPTGRVGRYPKHPFLTRELPFSAQPFCIAPVLPGETLQNLYFESRVVSDPILNPLIGWKKEYYFYYVPITLLLVDAIRDMFIDPANVDIAATYGLAASDTAFYSAKGGIDYVKRCVTRVVDDFYRDEGEVADDFKLTNGIPLVQIRDRLWMDSLTDEDDAALATDPASSGSPANMEQLNALYEMYDQLKQVGIAQMTFEDFIRSYGIAVPEVLTERKSELLARFSDFQYPSNTIDASTGTPSSALSWVFKNGKRDPKFFKEPGFIVGISVTRPKVYFGGLAGNLSGFLTRAWDWLPRYLNEGSPVPLPETAMKKFAAGSGPLGDRASGEDAYWVEMRDLFLYGDQFHSYRGWADAANPAADYANHLLAIPAADAMVSGSKYPTEAMCKGFFKDAAGTAFYVRQDGYVSFQIKGAQSKSNSVQGQFLALEGA
jgi:hypothetical protein